jgi:hypothetical protein
MRPIPIPDELVPEGALRRVIGPPGGDLTSTDIGTVEAIVANDELHGVTFAVLVSLEPGDLERLADCGGMWLTFRTSQMPVWSLEVADGQGG